jgi:ubiquinone biosynthesis protein
MEEVFESFDLEPLASASIAHVHRATLPDGREVAVKIRRPGSVRQVEADLALMARGAHLLAKLPPLRVMPLTELVAELSAPIRQQLDFEREAENLRRFRTHFEGVEHIAMPVLVEELCTPSVLTMEYLDGLEKVTSERFSAAERRTAALAGLRALYRMIFTHGFVHADMHPGNVYLRRWGEVVILDMGLVAELSDDDLRDFVDFFFGLVNDQGEICARILWETAPYRAPRADREQFTAAIVELVSRHARLKSHEFEVSLFVYQLIDIQRRSGIRGATNFIMTVLSMVVFDGICKQLYPDCDFQREARGFLIMARYRKTRMAAAV